MARPTVPASPANPSPGQQDRVSPSISVVEPRYKQCSPLHPIPRGGRKETPALLRNLSLHYAGKEWLFALPDHWAAERDVAARAWIYRGAFHFKQGCSVTSVDRLAALLHTSTHEVWVIGHMMDATYNISSHIVAAKNRKSKFCSRR